MICPKRTAELLDLHLAPFKDKDPAWEIGVSKIAGRGVFSTRNITRGEVIFRDSPLIIGPAARKEESLNSCSLCFKELPDTKFMCRNGCSLPICTLCAKKKDHKVDCELFKSWVPCEPDVANSVIIRLLCVARAINLTRDQRDLIYCLQATLDNNHRTEVRMAAKCFKNFPTDKKVIEIMNRTVAVLRTNGFDETSDHSTDNQEFYHRALYPLFAVMNHDCVPNSYYTFEPKTNIMTVRASVDIPATTEITTTYTKIFSGNIARHLFLKMKKTFTCKCSRCCDPTENGAFISAVYCRDTNCTGLAVPETTGLPHPNWNCNVCKQKSSHAQIMKSQDFASGAINAKLNSKSLRTLIEYISVKSGAFIPESNYVVIEAKLNVIARLTKSQEDCNEEQCGTLQNYCQDILQIMDKLRLGDCLLRIYLETVLTKEQQKKPQTQQQQKLPEPSKQGEAQIFQQAQPQEIQPPPQLKSQPEPTPKLKQ